ncbi:site-specific integrase [Pseudomonas fluvialis]|uniref:site-specific integrase n=1 Tax=Pseudomonas fluvialis TaxID=1793966 RepID=UPI0035AF5A1D
MATTKTKEDKRITDLQVRNLKGKLSEPADKDQKRGFGTLLFERRSSGIVEAYYRQRVDGGEEKLKIGVYKASPRAAGLTVSQIRGKANEYAAIAAAHGSVKAYIEGQEAAAAAERAERQRLVEIEASRGTFGELFCDYIESRRGKATPGVVKELERLYQKNMLGPHPGIMAMKARDIRSDHILDILNPIWARGAKVQAERMRSFLAAAFTYGLKAENAVGRSSSKSYCLESNPATVVAVEKVSAPATRSLSEAELRQFWETIERTEGVGPIMALLFKFVIATGGQRIFNVCQTTWDHYDLQAGNMRLVHRKGRGGQTMSRPHLVPLTERAIAIVERVKEINGCHLWPWTSFGRQHFVVSSPRHAIADWLQSEHAVIDGKQIPSFSPRDLRRTCAQLMQRHGISDQLSDLLQAHGQTGVANLHYRNNPEAALPEKRRAIELFDRALARVLGEEPVGNVVMLAR